MPPKKEASEDLLDMVIRQLTILSEDLRKNEAQNPERILDLLIEVLLLERKK